MPYDRDDEAIIEAQATLNQLRDKYWDAKTKNPPPSFDDLFDLRKSYEDAVVEYAGLEGRMLRDDILTKPEDLVTFREARARMAAAVEVKQMIAVARDFIKLVVSIA
jgi:hypothetical protein